MAKGCDLVSHRIRVTMIDGEGEARKYGNDDAAFPRNPFLVCPDRPMNDRIANLVLHFHIIHDRPDTPAWSMSKPHGQVAWMKEKEGSMRKRAGLTT